MVMGPLSRSPMKNALAALLIVLLLPACSGGRDQSTVDDPVQIVPDEAADADFLVMVLNRRTVLFNGDLPHDRLSVTRSRLKTIGCRDPRMLRERAEEQDGTWSFGGKRIIYYSEWKCVRS
jgi:hypothetical protein